MKALFFNTNKREMFLVMKLQGFRIFLLLFLIAQMVSIWCGKSVVGDGEGTAVVSPTSARVGEFGTFTVTYTTGKSGMQEGGGIMVQFPNTWHQWHKNCAKGLHSIDPQEDQYVSANCSRENVKIELEIPGETTDKSNKNRRDGIDSISHRYAYVTKVKIVSGKLNKGDIIDIIYGDKSGGSSGFSAPFISSENEKIIVVSDVDGNGVFSTIQVLPTIAALPEEAFTINVVGRSNIKTREPFELKISVVDKYFNPVTDFWGEVHISSTDKSAYIPKRYTFAKEDNGHKIFQAQLNTAGIHRINVSSADTKLEGKSNPLDCKNELPDLKIYWGDIHSHGKYSHDAIGDHYFEYARDISALDFYCLADHSSWLSDAMWENTLELNRTFYQPGKFVTIVGYEASYPSPTGHFNVYHRGGEAALHRSRDYSDNKKVIPSKTKTIEELWNVLEEGDVITVPHHTGINFATSDWEFYNPEFELLAEIYSLHGLGELDDPDHPSAYGNTMFSLNSSIRGKHYVRDAWEKGMILGVIASSDNHTSQPGTQPGGLAGVFAENLTREKIFDALKNRRTYATTGARILLDFKINGEMMGSVIQADKNPAIKVTAAGTDQVDIIEVFKYDFSMKKYESIYHISPGQDRAGFDFVDTNFKNDSFYYVRVTQASRAYAGMFGTDRVEMAWSSPIWVFKK